MVRNQRHPPIRIGRTFYVQVVVAGNDDDGSDEGGHLADSTTTTAATATNAIAIEAAVVRRCF